MNAESQESGIADDTTRLFAIILQSRIEPVRGQHLGAQVQATDDVRAGYGGREGSHAGRHTLELRLDVPGILRQEADACRGEGPQGCAIAQVEALAGLDCRRADEYGLITAVDVQGQA